MTADEPSDEELAKLLEKQVYGGTRDDESLEESAKRVLKENALDATHEVLKLMRCSPSDSIRLRAAQLVLKASGVLDNGAGSGVGEIEAFLKKVSS